MRDRDPNLNPVIGVDATYSVGNELSGVAKYSLHLMDGLLRLHNGPRLRRYYRPHRWVRAPWPKRLLFDSAPSGVDVFHGLNQRLPRRGKAKMVSTFHDLFVLSGEYSTLDFRDRFAAQAREAAERSDLIIAVSEFTKSQVVSYLGYPQERVRVVPHGVVLPAAVRAAEHREKIVLTVGAVQKRKNTRRLIEAFEVLGPEWELWIAGSAGFEAEAMLADLPSNVKVLGYVSDSQLAALYQKAAVFAFPSLDEGFGIPVLEAMAHGVAVLTSNVSALPETAGDAGLLVNPLSVDEIGAGLKLLADLDARRDFVMRGLERAKGFGWEQSVAMTGAVYAELSGAT